MPPMIIFSMNRTIHSIINKIRVYDVCLLFLQLLSRHLVGKTWSHDQFKGLSLFDQGSQDSRRCQGPIGDKGHINVSSQGQGPGTSKILADLVCRQYFKFYLWKIWHFYIG